MSKLVYAMFALNDVNEGLEKISNVKLDSPDQHVNEIKSRVETLNKK